jgi:hypothetical protein
VEEKFAILSSQEAWQGGMNGALQIQDIPRVARALLGEEFFPGLL